MALETTATFIGHNECFGLSAEKLKNEIRELIEKGVTDFLSGGQGGFDRLCGRCVYELKKEYPHINNYLVIPYLSFNVYDKELFDRSMAMYLTGSFPNRSGNICSQHPLPSNKLTGSH